MYRVVRDYSRWRMLAAHLTIGAFTFVEQAALNLVGPLFTAIVVGIGAAAFARRAQTRRENHLLRDRLIGQAIEGPSSLYLATQHYWRAKKAGLDLGPYRTVLDEQYLASRRQGLVLEYSLRLHFADTHPRHLSHRAMDLLTIRYFQLVQDEPPSPGLREDNAGDEHSGLSAADLLDPKKVLDKYRATIDELVDAIASGALDKPR